MYTNSHINVICNPSFDICMLWRNESKMKEYFISKSTLRILARYMKFWISLHNFFLQSSSILLSHPWTKCVQLSERRQWIISFLNHIFFALLLVQLCISWYMAQIVQWIIVAWFNSVIFSGVFKIYLIGCNLCKLEGKFFSQKNLRYKHNFVPCYYHTLW